MECVWLAAHVLRQTRLERDQTQPCLFPLPAEPAKKQRDMIAVQLGRKRQLHYISLKAPQFEPLNKIPIDAVRV